MESHIYLQVAIRGEALGKHDTFFDSNRLSRQDIETEQAGTWKQTKHIGGDSNANMRTRTRIQTNGGDVISDVQAQTDTCGSKTTYTDAAPQIDISACYLFGKSPAQYSGPKSRQKYSEQSGPMAVLLISLSKRDSDFRMRRIRCSFFPESSVVGRPNGKSKQKSKDIYPQ